MMFAFLFVILCAMMGDGVVMDSNQQQTGQLVGVVSLSCFSPLFFESGVWSPSAGGLRGVGGNFGGVVGSGPKKRKENFRQNAECK